MNSQIKMALALEDPIESLGYEITTLLQFSCFGLVGQLIFAILIWTTYSETTTHLGLVTFVIYSVVFVASAEQDWETLNRKFFPPNEDSQAARIIVDLCVAIACWDNWKISDSLEWGPQQGPGNKSSPEVVMIQRLGPFLSCIVFIMGSYIGCLAHLSLFRLVTNWIVGVRMFMAAIGLGSSRSGPEISDQPQLESTGSRTPQHIQERRA